MSLLLLLLSFLSGPVETCWYRTTITLDSDEILHGWIIAPEHLAESSKEMFQAEVLASTHIMNYDSLIVCSDLKIYDFTIQQYGTSCTYCTSFIRLGKNHIKNIIWTEHLDDHWKIIKLSTNEIELLSTPAQTVKAINMSGTYAEDNGGDAYCNYWMISHNQKYTGHELNRLSSTIRATYMDSTNRQSDFYQSDAFWSRYWEELKDSLAKEDLIMIEVCGW